ncbi:MAG: hypothetical protein M1819_001648 [Sarea resinae]|nr:MAG: hypothetical protein M1819_001648 [Sarea resinae]
MADSDLVSTIVLAFLVAAIVFHQFGDKIKAFLPFGKAAATGAKNEGTFNKERSIVESMVEADKDCVVFYGTQTGNAEDYANRLAKEGHSRFGLKTMVANLEDYDYEDLDNFPEDKVMMVVASTYGEGEPTDNAVDFYNFFTDDQVQFQKGGSVSDRPLGNIKYVTFGLGNKTYEYYNAVIHKINTVFESLGATRIGPVGEGDDSEGTLEEDFLTWKETMWAQLAQAMNLEERESVYEAVFNVEESSTLTKDSSQVFVGEPNAAQLNGTAKGPYHSNNPYVAPIVESKELFGVKDRNCMHIEIDLSQSNLAYETGDHLAILPTNARVEVERCLEVFGLSSKRDTVIDISPLEPTAKLHFPTPTTYEAVFEYYLEICAPVSRQLLTGLANFAPTDSSKQELIKLGSDKDYFHEQIANHYLNLAQTLQKLDKGPWNVPLSFLIEGFHKLQPRFYSISSSSLVQKNKVSITAVVDRIKIPGSPLELRGVTTNYLMALMQKQHGNVAPEPHGVSYSISGPRNKYDGIHVPVFVRHSNFRLPTDPSKPIIMIGPGTGVAPFRAFVQERAQNAKSGQSVGPTLLFFGCRNSKEDFIYQDEWKQYQAAIGKNFKLITAFSREGAQKVYVQNRLKEHGKEVCDLLSQGAYVYVCGDAGRMARDVHHVITDLIAESRGLDATAAEEVVKGMRTSAHYQEDVW